MTIGRPLPNVTVRERVSVDCFARRWPLLESRRPPPAQVLRPPFVADEEQLFLPEQVLATYALQTPPLVERDETQVEAEVLEQQRARGRKAGAKKRHEDAQFPEKVSAAIDDRSDHPDGSEMKPRSLAKKIIRYRKQK
jgi:hypothetical protein